MSIIHIVALVECDKCGYRFQVAMEESRKVPKDWTLFDCAEDAVRGGIDVVDGIGSTSVQDNQMLCTDCTKKIDQQAVGEDK